ncbi:hypothetical protein E6B08_23115 [Pseudomonas putida]|uniref:Uncharacterized protein n=1 Tax=Pseudomonas putida TaxID=303 RepID=A0A4D6XEC6_PSEPU|nr:hypothetical protein [Pseudomonas putida]QCI14057.1 hypothetical protein E6B08_23115 [Pseudomonas putida]
MQTEQAYPSIPAIAGTEQSALAFAHQSGLNAIWLEALSLVISRLNQFGQTVAPVELTEPLQELERLQYVEVETCTSSGVSVSLLGQPALLTNYFWSVWVPKHLLGCGLKVAVAPHPHSAQDNAHHCTVVFRIPGSREAAREFLTDLATQYPGSSPEIVAIQTGHALCAGGGQ